LDGEARGQGDKRTRGQGDKEKGFLFQVSCFRHNIVFLGVPSALLVKKSFGFHSIFNIRYSTFDIYVSGFLFQVSCFRHNLVFLCVLSALVVYKITNTKS